MAVNLTEEPAQIVAEGDAEAVTVGVGFTVIVIVTGAPVQVPFEGVTV